MELEPPRPQQDAEPQQRYRRISATADAQLATTTTTGEKMSFLQLTQEERQEALLFDALVQWFNQHPQELDLALRVLSNKRDRDMLSLTLLDWYVSRYAKHHDCKFLDRDGIQKDVYCEYVLQLRGFSKRR